MAAEKQEIDLSSPLARAVLTAVQVALPLEERPYAALGAQVGAREAEVFSVVEAACEAGVIRRMGASFDSYKLGYVSTLVAAAVPRASLERVAELVGEHSGITHNYERDDRYNLWFTCIARGPHALSDELTAIKREANLDDLLVLPALRLFKVKVAFDLRNDSERTGDTTLGHRAPAFIVPTRTVPVDLDSVDVALVRVLQGNLAGTLQPFSLAAARVSELCQHSVCQAEVIERTRALLKAQACRRIGAMVRHRKLGFTCNAMGVWNVRDALVEQTGAILARPAAVSHCYERPRCASWKWNMYTMIHGSNRQECERVASDLHAELRDAGINVDMPRMLISTREFKKTSMRYFEED